MVAPGFRIALRQLLKALAAAATVSILAACAQIPTSGNVQRGPQISEGLAGEFLYYSPNGPSAGDSQEEIIRGFINAGTSPQNDYSTAREFLASSLKGSWNPSEETLVQRGAMSFEISDTWQIEVTTGVQGQVGSHGEYAAQPTDFERQLTFRLVQENGQWRISQAPNLTMVIAPVFDIIFEPYSLYFFDRQKNFLVPDVRWFPSRASTTTLITNALLDGPSPWLRDGVTSSIPSGTNLAIDSVAIANGVAQVDLTARALVADSIQARQMRAQILATLSQVTGVSDVAISIERTPQDIAVLPVNKPVRGSKAAIALIDGSLRQVSESQALVRNSSYPLGKVAAKDFALNGDESRLALLDEQGIWVTRLDSIGQPVELIDNRTGLLNPQFDTQGFLWLTASSSASALVTVAESGQGRQVEAPWLQGMKRRAIAVSPNGSRLAVLEQRATGNRLWVAVIVRNAQGQPERLGNPIELTGGEGSVLSMGWDDESGLAVLTEKDGNQTPKLIKIGGLIRELPIVNDGAKILANPADGAVYVLTSNGDLFQNRNAIWALIQTSVSAVHFAG